MTPTEIKYATFHDGTESVDIAVSYEAGAPHSPQPVKISDGIDFVDVRQDQVDWLIEALTETKKLWGG
jgi:hypothetical protein